jgi:hypothetical protein
MRSEVLRLADAARIASVGQVNEARRRIATLPNDEIRDWCVEHGQMSGIHRYRALGAPSAATASPAIGPRNPGAALARVVFARDRYSCRYCGLPVVTAAVLFKLRDAVGADVFPVGRANRERHGLALLYWAQLDHVTPFKQGGPTSVDNVVTACWACNYGKDRFAVAQIGIDDPRNRTPSTSDWDGLTSLLTPLRSIAHGRATSTIQPDNEH